MTRRAAFLALSFITSLSMPIHADEENHHFTVALPAQWQHANRIRLVLEGVTVPGDRPLKLRVTAITEEQQSLVLGSAGIVAAGRPKSGPRHLPALLIDVTQALKLLTTQLANAQSVTVVIQAVDRRNERLAGVTWSAERLRLETTQK
jgi:hypothetical protein